MSQGKRRKPMQNRIKQLCRERGWTIAELARRAGIPVSTVYAYVGGHRVPSMATAYRIAQVLHRAVDEVWSVGVTEWH